MVSHCSEVDIHIQKPDDDSYKTCHKNLQEIKRWDTGIKVG